MRVPNQLRKLATVIVLSAGTAAAADEERSNQIQARPISGIGPANMLSCQLDMDADGIVSPSEASLHASALFVLLDHDGDDQISEDEYLASAPATLSRGRRAVERQFLNRLVRFANMDRNSDTKVTLAEFITAAESGFEMADTNSDGMVTVWEFHAQRMPF